MWINKSILIGLTLWLMFFSGILATKLYRSRQMVRSHAQEIESLKQELEIARLEARTYKKAVRIIVCESDGIHFRQGKHQEYGIAQFKRETFNQFKKEMGKPQLNWRSKWDQLEVLLWAIAHGKEGHWTCKGE